jgi:hypothetical protein
VLSFALPVLALAMLLRTLYVTRGRYRLADDVLEVPGHPPVPLSAISQIDRRLWERKGIAMLDYELADGRRGRLKLDDYAYQRKPTDAIFARIEQSLMSAAAPEEPAAS